MFNVNQIEPNLKQYIHDLIKEGRLDLLESMKYTFSWSSEDLGQAIIISVTDTSKPREENNQTKTIKPIESKPIPQNPDNFTFYRKLNGGIILNENDPKFEYGVSEKVVKTLGLKDLMHVEFDENNYIHVLSEGRDTNDRFIEFPDAILEASPLTGKIQVQRNIHGELLSDYNTRIHTYIPMEKYLRDGHLEEGDLVTLAWEASRPNFTIIRDFTHTSDLPEKEVKTTVKKTKDSQKSEYKPSIDLELNGKTVALIIGDSTRKDILEEMIHTHNGELLLIDGFKTSTLDKLESQLEKTDIVVITNNYIKHSVSYKVSDAVQNLNKPFAVSPSLGLASIERAIWRALEGHPAYESSYNGDYPVIES